MSKKKKIVKGLIDQLFDTVVKKYGVGEPFHTSLPGIDDVCAHTISATPKSPKIEFGIACYTDGTPRGRILALFPQPLKPLLNSNWNSCIELYFNDKSGIVIAPQQVVEFERQPPADPKKKLEPLRLINQLTIPNTPLGDVMLDLITMSRA